MSFRAHMIEKLHQLVEIHYYFGSNGADKLKALQER